MKYWENGFYLEQNEERTRLEVTDERWQELLNEQSLGKEIRLVDGELLATEPVDKRPILDVLRKQREIECFDIVNRGIVWYDTLTAEQKQELAEWYRAWLDVTETRVIPTKPSWLSWGNLWKKL